VLVDGVRAANASSPDLVGVIARGARTLSSLAGEPTKGSRARRTDWWIDPEGRLAIRATVVRTGRGIIACAAEAATRAQLVALAPRLDAGQWGALADVRGSFALVAWDRQSDVITLARDRIGQRAFYARECDDAFWFGTDLDALLRRQPVSLDVASAVAYLARGHALTGRTLARQIRSVPAGHCVHHDRARRVTTVSRYWTPFQPMPRRSFRAKVAEVRARLRASVVAATTPSCAILLSGGVDSSFVACLAAKTDSRLVGFTIASGDNREDVAYARMVARAIQVPHVVVDLDVATAGRRLPRVLEEPVPASAWTAISHGELVAAIAQRGLTHALSGMGADELFGGYDRFVDYFYRQRRFLRAGGDWLDELLHVPEALFPGIATFFDASALGEVLSPRARRVSPPGDVAFYDECRWLSGDAHALALMGAHELQHRVPDLLLQTFEPVARAGGVVFSYPFLDRDMAHLAMTLGPDDQFWFEAGAWWAKRTLRAAARGVVPARTVMRPRIAYDVPIEAWLHAPSFASMVTERLAETRLWQSGLLRRSARAVALRELRALREGRSDGPGPACARIWALLTLGAWYDRYVEPP
jgi:asparagine synthase (glutamine-hydrolysing)